MDAPQIIFAILSGIFLILVTPSVLRQRERIWGPGRTARNEKAQELAHDPVVLLQWALREGLIILWTALIGVFAMAFSLSFMVVDHIRGIPQEHFAYTIFMLMFAVGGFFAYIAIRSTAQLADALESVGESDEDAQD